MKKEIITLLIIILISLIGISVINAHGVDVTEDTMIIADESNGIIAKEIADKNGINISVYKFTSKDEVSHQLEHMLTNNNKKVLVIAYQDIATNFLNNHSNLTDRLIIEHSVNNETIKEGILRLTNNNISSNNEKSPINVEIPLICGLIIGFVFGLSCGVLIMKKKN